MMNTNWNPTFTVAGLAMSRVWHCFGNYMHSVDLPTVIAMIGASKTNVLPINTHLLSKNSGQRGLKIGFGEVYFEGMNSVAAFEKMMPMLNINHQITAQAAIEKTRLAVEMTNIKLIKLEVLNDDLKTSNDVALIQAVAALKHTHPDLIIMPLLSNNFVVAADLVELGCPLLRVMGSPIGSGAGIIDAATFERICTLPVPIVLDGGVRNAADLKQAIELGAQGCLINSALFMDKRAPQIVLSEFMQAAQKFWN